MSEAPKASPEDPEEQLYRLARENPGLLESMTDQVVRRKLEAQKPEYASKLGHRLAAMREPVEFSVGDIVCWKTGLKNKSIPGYDEGVIVVQTLDEPVLNEEAGPGSAYFREPLDLLIGILDPDDELIVYHVDSRRFKLMPQTST